MQYYSTHSLASEYKIVIGIRKMEAEKKGRKVNECDEKQEKCIKSWIIGNTSCLIMQSQFITLFDFTESRMSAFGSAFFVIYLFGANK